MKTDQFTKVMLCIIAVLLLLNLLSGLFPLRPAIAEQAGPVNRYQISAWAAQRAFMEYTTVDIMLSIR